MTKTRIDLEMDAVISAIAEHVAGQGAWVSKPYDRFGAVATIMILPANGTDHPHSKRMGDPHVIGLRAITAAKVHIMFDYRDNGNGSHVFRIAKGDCYKGVVRRLVRDDPFTMITLAKIEDAVYDDEIEPDESEVHQVPRGGIANSGPLHMMTAVGDRVRIIHPDDEHSPVTMINEALSSLRIIGRD